MMPAFRILIAQVPLQKLLSQQFLYEWLMLLLRRQELLRQIQKLPQ